MKLWASLKATQDVLWEGSLGGSSLQRFWFSGGISLSSWLGTGSGASQERPDLRRAADEGLLDYQLVLWEQGPHPAVAAVVKSPQTPPYPPALQGQQGPLCVQQAAQKRPPARAEATASSFQALLDSKTFQLHALHWFGFSLPFLKNHCRICKVLHNMQAIISLSFKLYFICKLKYNYPISLPSSPSNSSHVPCSLPNSWLLFL